MKKEEFRELLTSWVEDLSIISQTDELYMYENHEEIYRQIRTMWAEHRDIFPNKGIYKQIRRMFIKKLARHYNVSPHLWRSLSAEMCKEILHKADQEWISFTKELQPSFRWYLILKSAQAGYAKRKPMYLCYVDENLKIVHNKDKAVGLAHIYIFSEYDATRVEILFLRPLTVGDVSRSKAKAIIEKWGKSRYTKYKIYLPSYATCCVANRFLSDFNSNSEPVVHSCHVDRIKTSYSGTSLPCLLDSLAEVKPAKRLNKSRYAPTEEVEYIVQYAQKVYASVYMTVEKFVELNPSVYYKLCHNL